MTMTKISSSTITTSTPRSNSIINAVTPGTTAYSARGMNNSMNNNSTCNDKMPSSTSDSLAPGAVLNERYPQQPHGDFFCGEFY